MSNIVTVTPEELGEKNIIYLQRLSTPLGEMYAGASDEGLCLLEFIERRMLKTECTDLRKRLKAEFVDADNVHIQQVREELDEYFDGRRKIFTVPLHTPGTNFQQQVWEALKLVAYGSTMSYSALAEVMGNVRSVRAAANAVGQNRIGIIIPCHRIIGKDGSLTGYGGGLHRKRALLDLEADHEAEGR
ncbi:MAG: methylated-DNA--[protein]-cysteine S-methyltransferase [Salinispira sp.]